MDNLEGLLEINSTDVGTEAGDILAAGAALVPVKDRLHTAMGKTFYKHPNGALTEIGNLREGACPHERDIVEIHGASNFIRYLKGVDLSTAAIFLSACKFTCILDFYKDASGGEGLKNKTVFFQAKFSEEFNHWKSQNRKPMGQRDLAEHIEERLNDVVNPEGDVMLDIVNNFTASNTQHFSNAQRLATGQVQLTYNEDIEASGGSNKKISIPENFTLALSVFEREIGDDTEVDVVPIEARFRYKIRSGDLTLTYLLSDLNDVVRNALETVYNRVQEGTGISVYGGKG